MVTTTRRASMAALAAVLALGQLGWLTARVVHAQQPPEAADEDQIDVSDDLAQATEPQALTRGPVHEAFAVPYSANPEAGLVIDRPPPDPIDEVPPEIKPEDDDVVWIPGYWAWDADLKDFVWVSGVWRKPPPGQRWVPGYWNQVADNGGWQWVPGMWVAAEEQNVGYLPQPPESLDQGPNSPQPSDDHFWVSGSWQWQVDAYRWRPGYWSVGYTNWVWVPSYYTWTPYGYVYCGGYWDYPGWTRGWLFAPYYFPGYRCATPFYPQCVISIGAAFGNFWVWPGYSHYYFGDYYAFGAGYRGFYPWHRYHCGTRFGYDPLFSHYGRVRGGGFNAYYASFNQRYVNLSARVDLRPPRTFNSYNRWQANLAVQNAAARNGRGGAPLARSLRNAVESRTLGSVRQLDPQRRQEFVHAAGHMRNFAGQRQQLETMAARQMLDSGKARARIDRLALPNTRLTEARDARPRASTFNRSFDRLDAARSGGLQRDQGGLSRGAADFGNRFSQGTRTFDLPNRGAGIRPGIASGSDSAGPRSDRPGSQVPRGRPSLGSSTVRPLGPSSGSGGANSSSGPRFDLRGRSNSSSRPSFNFGGRSNSSSGPRFDPGGRSNTVRPSRPSFDIGGRSGSSSSSRPSFGGQSNSVRPSRPKQQSFSRPSFNLGGRSSSSSRSSRPSFGSSSRPSFNSGGESRSSARSGTRSFGGSASRGGSSHSRGGSRGRGR